MRSPRQQFHDFVAVTRLVAANDAQRQCDIFVRGQMVEQAEVLEHDTDAPPQGRERVGREGCDIMSEQGDQPARGPKRQKQHAQQ
jgi:hypothetical protein